MNNITQSRESKGVTTGGQWKIGQKAEPVSRRALVDAIRLTQQADPEMLGAAYLEVQREAANGAASAAKAHSDWERAFGAHGPTTIVDGRPPALDSWRVNSVGWASSLRDKEVEQITEFLSYAHTRWNDDHAHGAPSGSWPAPTSAEMTIASAWTIVDQLPATVRDKATTDLQKVAAWAEQRLTHEPFNHDGIPTSNHPDVQAGATPDQVVFEGNVMRKIDVENGDLPSDPYSHRFVLDRPLEEGEAEELKSYVQWTAMKLGSHRAEIVGMPIVDTPYSFVVHHDSTKGAVSRHIGDFYPTLTRILENGSDPRKDDTQARPPLSNVPKLTWYAD